MTISSAARSSAIRLSDNCNAAISYGGRDLRRAGHQGTEFLRRLWSKAKLLGGALALYGAAEGGFILETLEGDGPIADRLTALSSEAARLCPAACGCLVMAGTRNSACPDTSAMTLGIRDATHGLIRDRITRNGPDVADAIADFVMIALAGLSAAARDGATPVDLARSAAISAAGLRAELGSISGCLHFLMSQSKRRNPKVWLSDPL